MLVIAGGKPCKKAAKKLDGDLFHEIFKLLIYDKHPYRIGPTG
jgi:hypothetical protein